ncbi:bifunctional methylenetetrahydrofolate dehydrogenase/methenyltetrahydrofolate cyclohydrolase FolD [Bartonella sp. DGB1]|uniref:bifunctional methylenetetrahydrofolate dehydrogenase/methenyltetrahydrofolate cyclohydrolase FolD n=1 Tax=Bartonella sp. DGB1 TaxID=3239807 RepID=UPI00352500C9
MAEIIDGKKLANKLTKAMMQETEYLKKKYSTTPGLAVIILGNDPASQIYVNSKSKKAQQLGFLSIQKNLPENTSQAELVSLIKQLNNDPNIHGILVQLPLPKHIDPNIIIQTINADKDVDAFNNINVGKYVTNDNSGFIPCTPAGILLMIQQILGDNLAGYNALVVGRSNIVGKPMANLLINHNATVTIAHRYTKNLPDLCKTADILIVAVGKAHLIKANWVKENSIVIDVGINRINENGISKLVGDVDFNNVKQVAKAITPVPGGVGPMTIAMLMANTLNSTRLSLSLDKIDWQKQLNLNSI